MNRDQIKANYKRMTSEFLFPLLESRGYRRGAGGRYFKRDAEREFRVAPGLASRGKSVAAVCQIGAAVAFPKLWEFLRQSGVSEFHRPDGSMYSWAACGGLIYQMLPRGSECSWEYIADTSDPEAMGNELVSHFQTYVFPFLDRHARLEDAAVAETCGLDPMPTAGALFLTGQQDRAFELLDVREEKIKADHAKRRGIIGQREVFIGGDDVPWNVMELRKFREFLKSQ